jgi:hypothetical protein
MIFDERQFPDLLPQLRNLGPQFLERHDTPLQSIIFSPPAKAGPISQSSVYGSPLSRGPHC